MRKLLTFLTLLVLAYSVGWAATTVNVSISDYATDHSWANGTQYSSITLDSNITAEESGSSNTGKYYSTDNTWRLYANESATLTIRAGNGYTIESVNLTFTLKDNGKLSYGNNTISSGSDVTVNSSSAVFTAGHASGTKGKVFITAIAVTYTTSGGGGSSVTAPSISFSSFTAGATSITATVTPASGVSGTYYRIGTTGSYSAYSTPVTIDLTSTASPITVQAYSYDAEQNESSVTTETFTVPDLSVSISPSSYTGTEAQTITLTPSNYVGNYVLTYKIDNGTEQDYSNPFTLSDVGAHTITAYAIDERSGGSTVSATASITINNSSGGGDNAMIVFDTSDYGTNEITTSGTRNLYGAISEGQSYVTSATVGSVVYGKEGSVRISSSSNPGSFTLNFASTISSKTVTQIIVKAAGWSSTEDGSFSLSSGETPLTSSNVVPSGTTLTDYTVTLSNPTALSSLTFTGVGGNRTLIKSITLEFEAAKEYTISVASGITNGSVVVSPTSSDGNENITVTATPDTGYQLASLTFNSGTPVTSGWTTSNGVSTYTYPLTTGDLEVGATFTKVNYQIETAVTTAAAGSAGCAVWMNDGFTVISDVATATYGATVKVQLHTVTNWMVDPITPITIVDANSNSISATLCDGDATDGPIYQFRMPASNVTITGNFTAWVSDLYILGTANDNSWAGNVGVKMDYNSSTGYSKRVYFSSAVRGGFSFTERLGNADYSEMGTRYGAPSNQYALENNNWTGSLSSANVNNSFELPAGIYDIAVNPAKSTVTVTQVTPTLTLSPAAGTVNTGTSVSAVTTPDLLTLLQSIDSNITSTQVTQGVAEAADATTWNASYTFGATGSKTIYAKAAFNNIVLTTSGVYTVQTPTYIGEYLLVTDVDELSDGDEIVITNSGAEGDAAAMSTTQNSNNRGQTSVTINSDLTLTPGNAVEVLVLENGWYFHTQDGAGGYLTATGSGKSNLLKTATEKSANTMAAITIASDGAAASVVFQGDNDNRTLRYNSSGSGLFSCYSGTSQNPVYIYRKITATGAYWVRTADGITNGTVAVSQKRANAGVTITVTPTPSDDYQVASVSYNDGTDHVITPDNGVYSFEMPSSDVTVRATFERIPHNITVSHVSGTGTVSGLPPTATAGTEVSFSVTPDTDLSVKSVTVDFANGSSQPLTATSGTYTFTMIAYDATITVRYKAAFVSKEYQIVTSDSQIEPGVTYLIVGNNTNLRDQVAVLSTTNDSNSRPTAMHVYPDATGIITSQDGMAVMTLSGTTDAYTFECENGFVNSNSGTGASGAATTYTNVAGQTASISIGNSSPYAATITFSSTEKKWGYNYNQGTDFFGFYASPTLVRLYKEYNPNQVKPVTFAPADGSSIELFDNVALASTTDGATMHYQIKVGEGEYGAEQTGATALVSGNIGDVVTVKAWATKESMYASNATYATYTITAPAWGLDVANNGLGIYTPGTYYNVINVTPAAVKAQRVKYGSDGVTDDAANIYFAYTTDGTDPTVAADGTPASGTTLVSYANRSIALSKDATLLVKKVVNVNGTYVSTAAIGGAYTFVVGAPKFNLDVAETEFDGAQKLMMTTETKNGMSDSRLRYHTAIWYTYTEDGTEPADVVNLDGSINENAVQFDGEYWNLTPGKTYWIKAVTRSDYIGWPGTATPIAEATYTNSTVTEAKWTINAKALAIQFSPASGSFVEAQQVRIHVLNALTENVLVAYTLDGSDPAGSGGIEYDGSAITVSSDATLKAYALEDRGEDDAEATAEATYRIGVQAVTFSPVGGNYYYGTQSVEMFSVTNGATIWYTTDGSDPSDATNSARVKYTAPIEGLAVGTHTFKAVSAVGSTLSAVREVTYTISEALSGNYLLNIGELNDKTASTSTRWTLENPVQVVYMSTYQNNGTTPEYCFVRDNTGYGLVYFGKNSTGDNGKTIYQMGDWLPGLSITGSINVWDKDFHPELGSSSHTITAWPSKALGNTAILPEVATIPAITGGTPTTENLWGHYVHLRNNKVVLTEQDNDDKWTGTITDVDGNEVQFYDKFYLYTTRTWTTDDNAFTGHANRYFDLYGIVGYFDGTFQVTPFQWIYLDQPQTDCPTGTYYRPTVVTLSTPDDLEATIWYKTDEMEDFVIYDEPFTVRATRTIEFYSTKMSPYNDELETPHQTVVMTFREVAKPVISPESVVKPVGQSTDVTIGLEEGVTVAGGTTIWYTTDGTSPKTSDTRLVYTPGSTLTFNTTTTVRAITEVDDIYSAEADSKTYTFVKSNGIVYDLVTDVDDLTEDAVFVIVNKDHAEAMSNTQHTDNRGAAGVMWHEDCETSKDRVYGNDDVAVFTLEDLNVSAGTATFKLHTSNGADNASTGYLYVAQDANNTLRTEAAADAYDNCLITATIDADGRAHLRLNYNGGDNRYLQYWNRDRLFSTYKSEYTDRDIYLYYKEATPLAAIERDGEPGRVRGYTIADELVGVYANGTKLWVKDQGNVSIAKTEKQDSWVDYVNQMWPVNAYGGNWDQSNWVSLDFGTVQGILPGDAEALAQFGVGKLIAPATITARYVDGVNYAMEVQSYGGGETLAINGNAAGQYTTTEATTKANIVTPANFNSNYTAGEGVSAAGRTYYFLNPKVQEVVLVNNVTWDGTRFVISDKSGTHNTADLDGAIDVDWSLCDNYNETSGPAALNQAMSKDENIEFKFLAVVKRDTRSLAPRRAPKTESGATSNLLIAPTSLDLDNGVYTDVTDVKVANREVKAVKYVDVVGRVSDRPFEGLNIIVTEYTDGSVETVKVLK